MYLLIIYHGSNVAILRLYCVKFCYFDTVFPSGVHCSVNLFEESRESNTALCIVEEQIVAIARIDPSSVKVGAPVCTANLVELDVRGSIPGDEEEGREEEC